MFFIPAFSNAVDNGVSCFQTERQETTGQRVMSRVAEWLKSAGLGQFAGNFSNTEEDQFLALQVPLLAAAQPSLLSPRSLARRARAASRMARGSKGRHRPP